MDSARVYVYVCVCVCVFTNVIIKLLKYDNNFILKISYITFT